MNTIILLSFFLLSSFAGAVENTSGPSFLLENRMAKEEADLKVVPGAEKKIIWFDPDHKFPTDYAILYLHGFSASRQEISPVTELVAKDIGANFYATRFTAHAIQNPDAFATVTAEDWYRDAEDALEVSKEIGKKTIIMATSTGTILATRLALQNPEQVAAVVMISPNFGLRNPFSALLKLPAPISNLLARVFLGQYRHWMAKNDGQAKYWDTKYNSHALVELMRMVSWVQAQDLHKLTVPVLMVYSPNDDVINPDVIPDRFKELGSTVKELETWTVTNDHLIAGDIISPKGTQPLRERVVRFLRTALSPK